MSGSPAQSPVATPGDSRFGAKTCFEFPTFIREKWHRSRTRVFDDRYTARWGGLFTGPYRGPVVLLNLLSNGEDLENPVGGPHSDVTTEEIRDRYEDKALRVLGKVGAQIAVVGTVDRVVVAPELRHYDDYGFAFYPSVDAFEIVFTAQERIDARVHHDFEIPIRPTRSTLSGPRNLPPKTVS